MLNISKRKNEKTKRMFPRGQENLTHHSMISNSIARSIFITFNGYHIPFLISHCLPEYTQLIIIITMRWMILPFPTDVPGDKCGLQTTHFIRKAWLLEKSNSKCQPMSSLYLPKLMWLLKLPFDQNSILIYYKPSGNFRSNISFERIQGNMGYPVYLHCIT